MKGFFSKNLTNSIESTGGKFHSCASCGLYKHCISPKMNPYGKFEKGILNIGEGPGQSEDERGKPWQGKPGRLLKKTYKRLGIDLFQDCLNINAVNCRPMDKKGNNRAPDRKEIDHCRSVLVWKTIMKYQPKVIVLFGGTAVDSVIAHRWQGGDNSIGKWRGWTIPDQEIKSWVCPTFHPSYLDRMNQPKEAMTIWQQDIERAIKKLDEPFPRYKKPQVEVITDLSVINEKSTQLGAFDYETNSLKPHRKGCKIKTAAISCDDYHAWAFIMPKTKEGRKPLKTWLKNKDITKMAHNMKFEEKWTRNYLKTTTKSWGWDSMLGAHLLDNRTGITSLKFQMYVIFGIIDYSSEVEPYLKASGNEHGNNSFNRIDELMKTKSGREMLLTYNGLDAVYERWLALYQIERIGWDFLLF